MAVRQIALDIETTGVDVDAGHRIIEIGCVELVDGEPTGNTWHQYLNPGFSQSPDVIRIHGLSDDFLADKPVFKDVAGDFLHFLGNSELIVHHAPFDLGFLNHELSIALPEAASLEAGRQIFDTLAMAKSKHPGMRNSLTALVKRYRIDLSGIPVDGVIWDALVVVLLYKKMKGDE